MLSSFLKRVFLSQNSSVRILSTTSCASGYKIKLNDPGKGIRGRDEGVEGARLLLTEKRLEGLFPTLETHHETFDGVPYSELPIVSIKCTKNNTHCQLHDSLGKSLVYVSAGIQGFKKAKRGTGIAAQATGSSLAVKARRENIRNVKVLVDGVGPGRMSVVKGLQMAGLRIVSISDVTPLKELGPRPKKARRL